MSNPAAQFLVALALAALGTDAAVTCAADYTAKTSVDDKYCVMDAMSCSTDSTCCTAPTPTKNCVTEAASIACDADWYNSMSTSAAWGSDKASCCDKKATCMSAVCSGQGPVEFVQEGIMEKDTTKDDMFRCAGTVASCTTDCCKAKTGTCYAWKTAGNICDAGKNIRLVDYAKTGSDKAACCTADVMCDSHACPSATHELKALAKNVPCAEGACTNEMCCQCKSTTCCAAATTCGANMYKDSAKDGVIFADKAKDCCTAKAQCKDSVTTNVSGARLLSSFWPLVSAFSMLGLVLRK